MCKGSGAVSSLPCSFLPLLNPRCVTGAERRGEKGGKKREGVAPCLGSRVAVPLYPPSVLLPYPSFPTPSGQRKRTKKGGGGGKETVGGYFTAGLADAAFERSSSIINRRHTGEKKKGIYLIVRQTPPRRHKYLPS